MMIVDLFTEITKKDIKWERSVSEKSYYISKWENEPLKLRINNFPEEPMFTLFYKCQSWDFDDQPSEWDIKW